MKMGKAVIMV